MAATDKQKANLIPFSKNDPNINRKGRPRKSISATLKALDEAGIKATTKSEIEDTYLRLMNCSQEELKELHKDKDQSMLVKIVASRIADKKGFDIVEKMLDRAIGKPKQDIGLQVDPEILPMNFTVNGKESE